MKLLMLVTVLIALLSACNFKENLKETGDAVQIGAQNAVEGLKEVPAAVSKASNEVEEDIRN